MDEVKLLTTGCEYFNAFWIAGTQETFDILFVGCDLCALLKGRVILHGAKEATEFN